MVRSMYSVLMTDQMEESCSFYKAYLGFSEAFSSRHFMMQDPNGILIDIIEMIPPSEEFQEYFQPEVSQS